MTFTDNDDMLMKVRKNKHKEYISYISTQHSKAPSIPTIQITTLMQKNGKQEHH